MVSGDHNPVVSNALLYYTLSCIKCTTYRGPSNSCRENGPLRRARWRCSCPRTSSQRGGGVFTPSAAEVFLHQGFTARQKIYYEFYETYARALHKIAPAANKFKITNRAQKDNTLKMIVWRLMLITAYVCFSSCIVLLRKLSELGY